MPSVPVCSPRAVPLTIYHRCRLDTIMEEFGAPLATSSPIRMKFSNPLPGFAVGDPLHKTPTSTTKRAFSVTMLAEQFEQLQLNDNISSPIGRDYKKIILSPISSSGGSSSNYSTSSVVAAGELSPINGSIYDIRNQVNSFIDESLSRCPSSCETPQCQRKPEIPRFHFPQGPPVDHGENHTLLNLALAMFGQNALGKCHLEDMSDICRVLNIPVYLKVPVFNLMTRGEERAATAEDFVSFWMDMTKVANDSSARFVYIVSQGRTDHVRREEFEPILMDIVLTHPGMDFLRSAVQLHSQYCEVIVTVIFWFLGKAFSEILTCEDIRRSNLIDQLSRLELIDDINISTNYFGYMHFFTACSAFFYADSDRDMRIDRSDMEKYDGGAIPSEIVDGIFSAEVCGLTREYIGLREFTNFLLSEEDKTHPMSHAYWMRVINRDGMAHLTIHRIEHLHRFIQCKMAEEGIEYLDFEDKLCQIIDAVQPHDSTRFRLADLKRNPKMAPVLLNSVVNWRKFFNQEIKEDFDRARLSADGNVLSPWDIFCQESYDRQCYYQASDLNSSEGSLL